MTPIQIDDTTETSSETPTAPETPVPDQAPTTVLSLFAPLMPQGRARKLIAAVLVAVTGLVGLAVLTGGGEADATDAVAFIDGDDEAAVESHDGEGFTAAARDCETTMTDAVVQYAAVHFTYGTTESLYRQMVGIHGRAFTQRALQWGAQRINAQYTDADATPIWQAIADWCRVENIANY